MLAFMTNYLNIHQLQLTLSLRDELGSDFVFISMSGITQARRDIGFCDLDRMYDFVIRAYENEAEFRRAIEIANNCDVLIAGSVENRFLYPRLKKGMLTFKYSERFFKEGYGARSFFRAMKHLVPFQKYSSLFFLCSSAYLPLDLNRYTTYQGRMLKWGYFPQTNKYDIEGLILRKKKNSILWCSRMVSWKHPEAAVEMARMLKYEGISNFQLNIVGDGDEMPAIKQLIHNYNLENCVFLFGSKKPEEVRKIMENSEIFIFTSDRNEGWGAVLNESMNSACAIVASHAIGSVPYLIDDNENGLIYKNGDLTQLTNSVKHLLSNESDRIRLSRNAYESVVSLWNGSVAAERIVHIIDRIENGYSYNIYKDGPCSLADIIEDNWY